MAKDIYTRAPLEFIDEIPVFSARDAYIKNYEHIAEDHLKSLVEFEKSPFMTEKQIQDSELQTSAVIRHFVRPGSTILDAGVGLGQLLKGMREFECYGVDVAIPYLKSAKSDGLKVVMSKLEELPYVDQYFDVIVACDVLEHVFSLDLVMAQLLRVLKPEGLLIIRVPNDECLDSYLTDAQPYAHSHVRSFTLTSLRLYLEKCFSLQYVDHRYAGYGFNSFSQIKYQTPSHKSNIRSTLSNVFEAHPELANSSALLSIKKLLDSSINEITDALIEIQKFYPEIYSVLAPDIVKPLEVIVTYKRP